MIDDLDLSVSTIRLLASQALKSWSDVAICNLILDEDYVVRTLAGRELHLRGSREIFERILVFSTSQVAFVRELSAFVLGQLGTPSMPYKTESLQVLMRLMADDSPEVRAAAAAAMGHLYFENMPVEVENALIQASLDSDREVRCCVAASLGRASKRGEVKAALNALLKDSDKSVREYAELGKDILFSK